MPLRHTTGWAGVDNIWEQKNKIVDPVFRNLEIKSLLFVQEFLNREDRKEREVFKYFSWHPWRA
jgi:hypothetical protein